LTTWLFCCGQQRQRIFWRYNSTARRGKYTSTWFTLYTISKIP
jgi:hypothetical protein